ncbi:MAG: hypothetical protein NT010_08860 [Proteobacteria bacterium]|nr:hypothetical protein [Pseudomonadota bacterium]
MDIEFHYYITYIIACRAGFKPEDARIIAYSSQYTDDNDTIYRIHEGHPDEYANYISQTMDIFNPQKEYMRIYPVFHFMPGTLTEITGDSAWRRDGKFHIMNTIPDNLNSRQLLQAALYSRNLYSIGIATHMYADTFAHQNFVGFNEGFNEMKGLFEGLIPNIGHADAKHKPDEPDLIWEDERLIPSISQIDNKKRFLEAARCIYEKYIRYLNAPDDSNNFITLIDEAIGPYYGNEEDRIDRYKALIGNNFIEYDKKQWFKEAIDFVNTEIPYSGGGYNVPISETEWIWRGNYKETDWYKFQESVKAYQWLAMDTVIGPIFEKMEFKGV